MIFRVDVNLFQRHSWMYGTNPPPLARLLFFIIHIISSEPQYCNINFLCHQAISGLSLRFPHYCTDHFFFLLMMTVSLAFWLDLRISRTFWLGSYIFWDLNLMLSIRHSYISLWSVKSHTCMMYEHLRLIQWLLRMLHIIFCIFGNHLLQCSSNCMKIDCNFTHMYICCFFIQRSHM